MLAGFKAPFLHSLGIIGKTDIVCGYIGYFVLYTVINGAFGSRVVTVAHNVIKTVLADIVNIFLRDTIFIVFINTEATAIFPSGSFAVPRDAS